jgi:hypothetical protein
VLDDLAAVGIGTHHSYRATVARQEPVGNLHADAAALEVLSERDQLGPAAMDAGCRRGRALVDLGELDVLGDELGDLSAARLRGRPQVVDRDSCCDAHADSS